MSSSMRLFLGIPIDPSVQEEIGRQFPDLPGNRVPLKNLHLTLHFLGNTGVPEMERLCRLIEEVPLRDPFEIELEGVGAFPKTELARVVWMDVKTGHSALVELHQSLEFRISQAGLRVEKRKFSPHLTLSRLKKMQDIRTFISHAPLLKKKIYVEHVVLFESHLESKGSRYEKRASFRLRYP